MNQRAYRQSLQSCYAGHMHNQYWTSNIFRICLPFIGIIAALYAAHISTAITLIISLYLCAQSFTPFINIIAACWQRYGNTPQQWQENVVGLNITYFYVYNAAMLLTVSIGSSWIIALSVLTFISLLYNIVTTYIILSYMNTHQHQQPTLTPHTLQEYFTAFIFYFPKIKLTTPVNSLLPNMGLPSFRAWLIEQQQKHATNA